jgi:S-adenosylmethionine:tRNA ribosyltransferase-isomerase
VKTEKLNYYLPPELIAQQPAEVRSASRLLVLDRCNGELTDSWFNKLGDFLHPGDCLVLNDTKVIPARFFARRETGAKLEGLFLAEDGQKSWQVMLKRAQRVKTGEHIYIEHKDKSDFCKALVQQKQDDGVSRLKVEAQADLHTILDNVGFPPLPPYIKRDDNRADAEVDSQRYQTVYAQKPGAVAAPTAGLHFTEQLINQLKQADISLAYLTLHVGTGTFKPINTDKIENHKIHREQFNIDERNAEVINQTKDKGGRVIAVGTTTTRVLETVAVTTCFDTGQPGKFRRGHVSEWRVPFRGARGDTQLFIKPGYKFKIVDAMITNFHLPRSTLLALVAAFAGLEKIMAAYQHAISKRYRFYSYGDAMLIL